MTISFRIARPSHSVRSGSLPLTTALRRGTLLIALAVLLSSHSNAQGRWLAVGPFGGDVRSLAADPNNHKRMYLGTRTGQIYLTKDGGESWSLLPGFHAASDWVVDGIVISPADPAVIYASAWSVGRETGGVFKSADAGATWTELEGIRGQSVRALAMAPSSSKTLVAGSLQGVFRTDDGGATWRRISPAGHQEIRNVESIAIDPRRPDVVYAGTWHLPWKTSDGGAHWASIKNGLIDDSDVFSIIVDGAHPETLYASACTGIYRSDSGGEQWRKLQGIPYSSRRTRVLMMDPQDPSTVFAGTTEGLWRTKNGGESWARLTSHTLVINAVAIDRADSRHVYLGTDQSGVAESHDGGESFSSSNRGFAQRQVSSIVADPARKGRYYAALVADGQLGSVMLTDNYGGSWRPAAAGLDGRDVLTLLLTTQPQWKLLAGTPDGVFELTEDRPAWQSRSQVQSVPNGPFSPASGITFWQLYRRDGQEPIYAATSAGLLRSADGRSWTRLPLDAARAGVSAVATGGEAGELLLASSSSGLRLSRDAGKNWSTVRLDGDAQIAVHKIVSSPTRPSVFFAGTSAGLFRSTDNGLTWEKFGHGMPFYPTGDIAITGNAPGSVWVATTAGLYRSKDGGSIYNRFAEGVTLEGSPIQLLGVSPHDDGAILAGTPFNGVYFYDGVDGIADGAATAKRNQ